MTGAHTEKADTKKEPGTTRPVREGEKDHMLLSIQTIETLESQPIYRRNVENTPWNKPFF